MTEKTNLQYILEIINEVKIKGNFNSELDAWSEIYSAVASLLQDNVNIN